MVLAACAGCDQGIAGELERRNAMRILLLATISTIGVAMVGPGTATAFPSNAAVLRNAPGLELPLIEAHYYHHYLHSRHSSTVYHMGAASKIVLAVNVSVGEQVNPVS